MLSKIIFFVLIGTVIFGLGFVIGNILGIKQGIDYCFDRFEEDIENEYGLDNDPMEKVIKQAKKNTLKRIK